MSTVMTATDVYVHCNDKCPPNVHSWSIVPHINVHCNDSNWWTRCADFDNFQICTTLAEFGIFCKSCINVVKCNVFISSYYVLKCKAIWLTLYTTQCESVHPANTQQAHLMLVKFPRVPVTLAPWYSVHQVNIGTHGTIGTLALLGACQPFHGACC